VEQILSERCQEIQDCHGEIRRSRVLDVQQYEWQAGRMKEGWFRKIDAVLDSDQHSKFQAKVDQGFFNEGLGFTLEPGIVVVDRQD
jgi:hypothetical protein